MALELLPQDDLPKIKSKALDLTEAESKGTTSSTVNKNFGNSTGSFVSTNTTGDSNYFALERKKPNPTFDEPLATFEFKSNSKPESTNKNLDNTNENNHVATINRPEISEGSAWEKATAQVSKFDLNVNEIDQSQDINFQIAKDNPQSVEIKSKPIGNRKSWDEVQPKAQFDLNVNEPVKNLETTLEINHPQSIEIKTKPIGNRKSWDEVKPISQFTENQQYNNTLEINSQPQSVEIKAKPIGNRKSWDEVKPLTQMKTADFESTNTNINISKTQSTEERLKQKLLEKQKLIQEDIKLSVIENRDSNVINNMIESSTPLDQVASFEDLLGDIPQQIETQENLDSIENLQKNDVVEDFFGLNSPLENSIEKTISTSTEKLNNDAFDSTLSFDELLGQSEPISEKTELNQDIINDLTENSIDFFAKSIEEESLESSTILENILQEKDSLITDNELGFDNLIPVQELESSAKIDQATNNNEVQQEEILNTDSSSVELNLEKKEPIEEPKIEISIVQPIELNEILSTEVEKEVSSAISLEKIELIESTQTIDLNKKSDKISSKIESIDASSKIIDKKSDESISDSSTTTEIVINQQDTEIIQKAESEEKTQPTVKTSFLSTFKNKFKKSKDETKPQQESFITRIRSKLNSDIDLNFSIQDLTTAKFYENLADNMDKIFQKRKKEGFLALELLPNKINYLHIFKYSNTDAKPLVDVYGSIQHDGKPMNAIKEIKALGLDTYPLISVINRDSFLITTIDQPMNIPRTELAETARWKIKDMIDYSPSEATVDILEIYPDPSLPPKNLQMFVIVSNNKVIEKVIEDFEKFKLKLDVIDIPQLVQRNVASLVCEENKGVAFLSITPSGTLLTITKNHEIYLQSAMDSVNLNALLSAIDKEDQLQMLFDRLVLDLQRRLDTFERQYSYVQISKLVLSPLPEKIKLEYYLGANLYLKVEQFDFKDYIDFGKYADSFADVSLQSELFFLIGASLR